jgi:6,7-dimethyl-8-ribityllumazine synthase
MGEYARYEGELDATGMRFAIVAARFNNDVTEPLCAGAEKMLRDHGAADVHVAWVPGAFELPLVAKRFAQSGAVDAVVCIGAVIRGETPHFDFVAGESARGLADVTAESGVPLGFGLLTTESLDQALARAGGTHGNKGADAALAALEMADLLDQLQAGDED